LKTLFFLLALVATLWAIEVSDEQNISYFDAEQKAKALKERNLLLSELESIQNTFPKNSIWVQKYNNYLTYLKLELQNNELSSELERLKKNNKKGESAKDISDIEVRIDTLQKQLSILKEYKDNPFASITSIKQIDKAPDVDNPIAIIGAFSFIKQLEQQKKEYADLALQLQTTINTTEKKVEALRNIIAFDPTFQRELDDAILMLDEFRYASNIFDTAISIYGKKADETITQLTDKITEQVKKSFFIVIIITALFVISILIKLATKKYISDNERLYTANKVVNFVNVTLIILILLFSYLENVSYLITVLGFASAGLAIAMKDLFMSLLGWLVIVFGGSIHVGDRIRVEKDGTIYVGDVLDISLLRITLHEDVTLTTYELNRRAGRIVFIPNNYIFTTLLSNYSHSGMKTVWDGIDVTVSFDSDHKKAMQITREIAKKYSKGYTDITRKQLNKLRDKYSMKNTSVEPRIFSFLEPNGIKISTWYLTNSFATLNLRSTISSEIIEEFLKHSDIKIAYPTTTINIKKNDPAMYHHDEKEIVEKSLF